MISVVYLHPAAAAFAPVVITVNIQISMKTVCLPAGTGRLLRCPIVYEINKIIGEKQHVWKISTCIMDTVSCRIQLESLLTIGLYIRQDAFQL